MKANRALAQQIAAAGRFAQGNAAIAAAIAVLDALLAALRGSAQPPTNMVRKKKAAAEPQRRRRRRAVEVAPAAPAQSIGELAATRKVRPRAESPGGGQAPPAAPPELLDANGVSVAIAAAGAVVSFGAAELTLRVKEGRMVACLARAMPHPVDPTFIAERVLGASRDFDLTTLAAMVARVTPLLAGIGLRLRKVGITGFSLQKEGE